MNIEDFTQILQENNKNTETLNEIHKATLNIKDEKTRELKQEIERLDKEIKGYIEFNKYLQKEIIKLTNSIKEAIDYINNHQLVFELSNKKEISKWCDMFYKELLEILYKGIDKE